MLGICTRGGICIFMKKLGMTLMQCLNGVWQNYFPLPSCIRSFSVINSNTSHALRQGLLFASCKVMMVVCVCDMAPKMGLTTATHTCLKRIRFMILTFLNALHTGIDEWIQWQISVAKNISNENKYNTKRLKVYLVYALIHTNATACVQIHYHSDFPFR